MINKAFILAAGKGMRMRPLTENCPKPLLSVAGRPIIDYALDDLKAQGITDIVVNVNYLGEMLEEHLKKRDDLNITISWEHEFLETGGGVKKCLDHFKGQPFFVLNGDVICTGGTQPLLKKLEHNWSTDMDILISLIDKNDVPDYTAPGDYYMDETGRLTRRSTDDENAPFVFIGPRIVHPRLFNHAPKIGGFSFLSLFDNAQKRQCLYGCTHDGNWHHIGTPEELKTAENTIQYKNKKIA